MNEHEAERIAAAMNQLRPDWPRRSLLTLIERSLMDRPRRDVAVALAWVACESGTSTPARVLESGPWWLAAAVAGDTTGRRDPYDPARHCSVCGKADDQRHPLDHAFESATDRQRLLAAEHRRTGDRRADWADYARQAVGDAKAAPAETPAPPEHEPNPHVQALKAQIGADQ